MVDAAVVKASSELLGWAISEFLDRFAIVTSFQKEGMVILDLAVRISPKVRVVTLDTGRLPAETFDMIELVRGRYGVRVEAVSPDAEEVETMVTRHGPNLFYEAVSHRLLCCHFRKVRPLARKLAGLDAYAVGLRRDQNESRSEVSPVAESNGQVKLSPLADWRSEDVDEYTYRHDLPLHPLYAKGYTSIGCDPCSRATQAGEDERAGRWWWEQGINKECGLHFSPDGRVERTVDVLIREILEAQHA